MIDATLLKAGKKPMINLLIPDQQHATGKQAQQAGGKGPGARRQLRYWLYALAVGTITATACNSTEEVSPTPTLPPDTTSPTPEATPVTDPGTDPVEPSNPSPRNTVTFLDQGLWTMSPTGGPYDAMSGTLEMGEYLNGAEEPSCLLTYALTGAKVSTTCSGCNYTFRIQHVLLEGDPEECQRTDYPEDGVYLIFGYSSETRIIYYDYADTGYWLPWYDALRQGDDITFEWSATYGTELDD